MARTSLSSSTLPAPSDARTDLSAHLPELLHALEEQRRFRTQQLAELTGDIPSSTDTGVDPHEQVTLALQAGALAALADIEAALHRMGAGTYGRCQNCDTAISVERLEVLPSAVLCMNCQHARETRRR